MIDIDLVASVGRMRDCTLMCRLVFHLDVGSSVYMYSHICFNYAAYMTSLTATQWA